MKPGVVGIASEAGWALLRVPILDLDGGRVYVLTHGERVVASFGDIASALEAFDREVAA
jgi:hypothetical protein